MRYVVEKIEYENITCEKVEFFFTNQLYYFNTLKEARHCFKRQQEIMNVDYQKHCNIKFGWYLGKFEGDGSLQLLAQWNHLLYQGRHV